jgi:hypothetical protein
MFFDAIDDEMIGLRPDDKMTKLAINLSHFVIQLRSNKIISSLLKTKKG